MNPPIQGHILGNLDPSVKEGRMFSVAYSLLSLQFLWKVHYRY